MRQPIPFAELVILAALVAAPLALSAPARAGELREIRPILRPDAGDSPGLEVAPEAIVPVAAAKVRESVDEVFDAWNDGRVEPYLADDFYDRTRLGDAIDEQAPRDARLRVLEVAGIQTLRQHVDPARGERVSIVSATVRAQLEFQDQAAGFVRREGRNELLLRVREPLVAEAAR